MEAGWKLADPRQLKDRSKHLADQNLDWMRLAHEAATQVWIPVPLSRSKSQRVLDLASTAYTELFFSRPS